MRHDKPYPKGEISTYSLFIETPVVKTYTLELKADHDYDIMAATLVCESGSCTGAFYIWERGEGGRFGVSVAGLDPISVSTTEGESTATGAKRVTPGDRVTFSVPANSTAADLAISVRTKRA